MNPSLRALHLLRWTLGAIVLLGAHTASGMVYGEREYGETYAQAVEVTGRNIPLIAKRAKENQVASGHDYGRGKVFQNSGEPIAATHATDRELAKIAGVSHDTIYTDAQKKFATSPDPNEGTSGRGRVAPFSRRVAAIVPSQPGRGLPLFIRRAVGADFRGDACARSGAHVSVDPRRSARAAQSTRSSRSVDSSGGECMPGRYLLQLLSRAARSCAGGAKRPRGTPLDVTNIPSTAA